MIERRRYLPALDGLRAVAVLAVVISHSWPQVLPNGGVGVDVFFVLSGYLITSILLGEHERTGRISLRHFYARRALRLLPALAATLVFAVLIAYWLYPGSASDTAHEAVAAALYVANWLVAFGDVQSGLLIHTWTLSIEEQFYWTWPLVLWALLTLGGRRAAFWATLVLVGVVVIHRLTGLHAFYFRTDARADALLIGCAVAIAAQARLFHRIPRIAIRGAAVIGALWLGLALAMYPLMEGIGFTLVALAAAAIVVAVAVRPLRFPVSVLSFHPLTWVGQRSYGIYLYHPLCLAIVAGRLGVDGPLPLLATTLLALVVAGVSYRYLEAPFLRRKSRGDLRDQVSLRTAQLARAST